MNPDAAAAAAQLGSYRDALPTHFTFKIQSFSTLATSSMDNFESNDFEAGGYKWRLVFYPKGNNKTNNNHYVYLKIVGTDSLPRGWELDVSFRFLVLDQVRDRYLIIGDTGGKTRRFHEMKTMWGVPLTTTLDNASNGFLVDDTLVFGAEVFPCKHTGYGGCLTMVKSPLCVKYTWKMEKFSKIKKECIWSDVFNADGYKWNIKIYPKGDSRANNETLSLYLCLNSNLDTDQQVCVSYKFSVRDQLHNKKELQVGFTRWLTSSQKCWGFTRFMRLDELNDESKGYLVNDTCIVEAEVTVLGSLKKLS